MEARDNPNYYFVSQNQSFKDENKNEYLWAPLKSKKGSTIKAYEFMKQIKKGDVIVHYNNDIIPGISIAKVDAYPSKKPKDINSTPEQWNDDGTRVDVEQYFSSYKIPKSKWIDFFFDHQPEYGSPIIKGSYGIKRVNLAYLFKINKILVDKVIQEMEANDESKEMAAKLRAALHQSKEVIKESQNNEGETSDMSENANKISQIIDYIKSKGFTYNDGLIKNIYLSLKAKPFVILAGTSGTGKSKLAKLFAESIKAEYKLVPVRPDWSDSSDLFGHLDLEGKFIPGAITDFIAKANDNLSKPHILCLDEMNLARVEYYLSDYLSVIETRRVEDGKIITDPVLTKESFGKDTTAFEKYGELSLPENLYIIGTVNMDETTFPFSKKVLDRANTIEFSNVDLSFPEFSSTAAVDPLDNINNDFIKSKYLILKDCLDYQSELSFLCEELEKINQILAKANLHVGYRVRDEIVFYTLNNKIEQLIDDDKALDNAIMQKILPRIQGSSNTVKEMLYELFKYCLGDARGIQIEQDSGSESLFNTLESTTATYEESAKKIAFMIRRFEEDGFTSFWL